MTRKRFLFSTRSPSNKSAIRHYCLRLVNVNLNWRILPLNVITVCMHV